MHQMSCYSTDPDAMHHPAAALQIAPAAALLSIRSMSDMAPMRHGLTLVILCRRRCQNSCRKVESCSIFRHRAAVDGVGARPGSE